MDKADVEHIARWDPGRVLAQCATRRAIVELYQAKYAEGQAAAKAYERGDRSLYSPNKVSYVVALHHVLQLFAAEDDKHPDFDPAWVPEEES
jgi:hypothetical protein